LWENRSYHKRVCVLCHNIERNTAPRKRERNCSCSMYLHRTAEVSESVIAAKGTARRGKRRPFFFSYSIFPDFCNRILSRRGKKACTAGLSPLASLRRHFMRSLNVSSWSMFSMQLLPSCHLSTTNARQLLGGGGGGRNVCECIQYALPRR